MGFPAAKKIFKGHSRSLEITHRPGMLPILMKSIDNTNYQYFSKKVLPIPILL